VNFSWALTSTKRLHQQGTSILAGTDAPSPGTALGLSLHAELALLVQAGLTPVEALRGGKSTAQLAISSNGAEHSQGALRVWGTVAPGLPFAWAGVMFSPGEKPMSPADLSSTKKLVFWAKGQPETYQVMFFIKRLGFAASVQKITLGPAWKRFELAFSDFDGLDGSDTLGIARAAGLWLCWKKCAATGPWCCTACLSTSAVWPNSSRCTSKHSKIWFNTLNPQRSQTICAGPLGRFIFARFVAIALHRRGPQFHLRAHPKSSRVLRPKAWCPMLSNLICHRGATWPK
jgi:hypothetical protein